MELLLSVKSTATFFNPWRDWDPAVDIGPEAPHIRQRHLRTYLYRRLEHVRYIWVAEAVGYRGGRFSGIPLTSERLLLGHDPLVSPASILGAYPFARTSQPELSPRGLAEPTASILWREIHQLGLNPLEILTWNAFPYHPYDPNKGLMSNRTPARSELRLGTGCLLRLKQLYPEARWVAIGQKAAQVLKSLGMEPAVWRHPAHGGASAFREGLRRWVQEQE